MSCYQRTRTNKAGQVTQDTYYTINVQHAGKQHARLTTATTLAEARKFETALKRELRAGNNALLTQFRLRRAPSDLTLPQLLTAYRRHAPIQQISGHTITTNIHALLNLLRTSGHVPIPADAKPADETLYAHVTARAFTPQLIQEYKTAIVQRALAAEADDEETQRHYRTANSILRQARSIFTKQLRAHYADAGLNLPDLTPFLARPGFGKCEKREYHPASDALINKTFAALPQLAIDHPNAHTAIWLTIGFGLRKSEIANTTATTFITVDGRPTFRYLRKTKNGDVCVDVHCQLDAWRHIQPIVQARAGQDPGHLLTGTPTERKEDTFRVVAAWMRELGWNTQKAIHEFRAWAGCQIAEAHGLLAARDFIRHAQYQTTEKYYGRYIRNKIPHTPLRLPIVEAPKIITLDSKQA